MVRRLGHVPPRHDPKCFSQPKLIYAGMSSSAIFHSLVNRLPAYDTSLLRRIMRRVIFFMLLSLRFRRSQADDTGGADPMCVLRRRGREVGRTTTIYGSLEPVWGSKSREGEVRHKTDTRIYPCTRKASRDCNSVLRIPSRSVCGNYSNCTAS